MVLWEPPTQMRVSDYPISSFYDSPKGYVPLREPGVSRSLPANTMDNRPEWKEPRANHKTLSSACWTLYAEGVNKFRAARRKNGARRDNINRTIKWLLRQNVNNSVSFPSILGVVPLTHWISASMLTWLFLYSSIYRYWLFFQLRIVCALPPERVYPWSSDRLVETVFLAERIADMPPADPQLNVGPAENRARRIVRIWVDISLLNAANWAREWKKWHASKEPR